MKIQDTMKHCKKCGEVKMKSDFNKSKREKDGLQHYCRECMKNAQKKSYEKMKSRKAMEMKSKETPKAQTVTAKKETSQLSESDSTKAERLSDAVSVIDKLLVTLNVICVTSGISESDLESVLSARRFLGQEK